jgi:hypothetical protein
VLAEAPTLEAHAVRARGLSADEAEFVQAAFERILPELKGVAVAACVEQKLGAPAPDDPRGSALRLYREGIAHVQDHCRSAHGRPFQALEIWHQLAVLAQLEDLESLVGGSRPFVDMLVNDAAEVYFAACRHRDR